MVHDFPWEVCDTDQKTVGFGYTEAEQGQIQIQDQVTLDEQLDLERVEAAVVI